MSGRKNNQSEEDDNMIPQIFEYTGQGSVPSDVVSVRCHPSVIEIEEDAFRGRIKLEKVVLNEGLKTIGEYSFCYCTSLQSITLPSTLVDIDSRAFEGCNNLREVVINEGLTRIESSAFDECRELKKVVLNEGLQKIGRAAFIGCRSLVDINIPSTVTAIGKEAFAKCFELKEVVFNKGLQMIDERAFDRCSSLLSISLPSTVTEIEDSSFRMCSSLRYISLNEGLQSIGKDAFAGCQSLESITMPSTIDEIGGDIFVEATGATFFNRLFGGCSSLTEVGINTNTEMISRRAFSGCDSLERFTFPRVSNRLERIIHCSKDIKKKVNEVRGAIQRKGGMLFASADSMGIGHMFPDNQNGMNWGIIRESLLKIDRWTRYYEIREATTLLELALWKANMNQAKDTLITNRDAYCIEVPGPVKETILKYLCPADQYMVWRGEAWLFPESDDDSDYSFSAMEDDSVIDQEMNLDEGYEDISIE